MPPSQAWVYAIPIYHEPVDPLRQAHKLLLQHFPTLSTAPTSKYGNVSTTPERVNSGYPDS